MPLADLRPVFEGRTDYSTGVDGIVFSDAGARASARAVWQLIEERCIAP
jgi:lysophospholipase L1-like esterase